MKRRASRWLSFLLTLCILSGLLHSTSFAANSVHPFADVNETDWFNGAVEYVYRNGLMNGTGSTVFSPYDPITRGQMVTILHRLDGTPSSTGASFKDVPNGEYYAKAVAWASANGIMGGYGGGLFGPADNITREQLAATMYRYAQYKGFDTTATGNVASFSDGRAVSSYAVEAVNWAIGSGLFTGVDNNMFAPADGSNRAQAATILMRFCMLYEPNNNNEETNNEANGETKVFDNGDRVFVPSEDNMSFDESESVIYYNNLLIAYTFSDLSSSEASALAAVVNGEIAGKLSGAINAVQIKVSETSLNTLDSMAERLMSDERVLYAGYEYPMQLKPSAADNNPWSADSNRPDPDRGNESNPDGNDWWAEAIGAYSAWEYASKVNPISVGIIDGGFQTDHPDLNGKINFLPQYSANTAEGNDGIHGTHVAGIISADNNSIGIRGVADQAFLYCVDWSPAEDVSYLSTGEYVEITKRLVELDVRVINNSWGNYFLSENGYTQAQQDPQVDKGLAYILEATGSYDRYVDYMNALSKRTARDCTSMMVDMLLNGYDKFLIVQAAGNGYDNKGPGIDTQNTGFYCAIDRSVYNDTLTQLTRSLLLKVGISYDSIADRKVIVGAVENARNGSNYIMTNFSDYGENVDICAPGANIYSTITGSGYSPLSGTSMAAPIVSGCLAYCWSLDPALTAPAVKDILLRNTSCSASGVGGGASYTYPMVNMGLAAKAALGIDSTANSYAVDGPKKDDRSAYVTATDGYSTIYNYYYEYALLSGGSNAEKINAVILSKKDAFFAAQKQAGHAPEDMNGLGSNDYGVALNNVAINDIFLSDRYFSVNLEHIFGFTTGTYIHYVGYTFDVRTGEIITLPEILGLSLDETKELVLRGVKEFAGGGYEAYVAEPAIQNSSAEDFGFCIKEDGTIYLLFSRDQYTIGPMSGEIMLEMQIDSGNKIYGYKS